MLSEADCEEIGTAVGMLTYKLFKVIYVLMKDLKGLFNSHKNS